jgi:hypothetical protein
VRWPTTRPASSGACGGRRGNATRSGPGAMT